VFLSIYTNESDPGLPSCHELGCLQTTALHPKKQRTCWWDPSIRASKKSAVSSCLLKLLPHRNSPPPRHEDALYARFAELTVLGADHLVLVATGEPRGRRGGRRRTSGGWARGRASGGRRRTSLEDDPRTLCSTFFCLASPPPGASLLSAPFLLAVPVRVRVSRGGQRLQKKGSDPSPLSKRHYSRTL
jgi:hypothetical protein